MITRKPLTTTTAFSCVIVALALTASLLSAAASLTPADHLLPPPLPLPQRLKHARAPAASVAAVKQPIPLHSVGSGENSVPPGFMTRIARWFGFGASGQPHEQQLTAASQPQAKYSKVEASGKAPYAYPHPNQQQQLPLANGKAPCSNCNKFPWVPMLPPGIQYPLRDQFRQQQQDWTQAQQESQILEAQASQQPQVKQRAVQFHFPFGNRGHTASSPSQAKLALTPPQYPPLPFLPIPVPNLSASALPPLYEAQPFRPTVKPTSTAHTEQQLPTTDSAHFTESLGAHSELQPDSVYPTQTPPSPSFEIVRSHQLTDFVSSVEYPTTFVQSQSFDVPAEPLPSNHKAATDLPNTVPYQRDTLDPKLSSSHVPASHLITEIGNFGSASNQQPEYSTLTEGTTSFYGTQPQTQTFKPRSQVVAASGNELYYDLGDNFPSASAKNFSTVQNNQQEELRPNWATDSRPQIDEFFYSTTQPPAQTTTEEFTEKSLPLSASDFVTESLRDTTNDFAASARPDISEQPQSVSAKKTQRERGTPKRLLDAPIAHAQGGQSPALGHVTRDPSELNFRLGANLHPREFQHANHAYAGDTPLHATTSPWLPTVAPVYTPPTSAAPTPTSTYGALDASGQYAGIAPPPPPAIVLPFITRNRARPFQASSATDAAATSSEGLHDSWSQANDVIDHVQQESKLVASATKAPAAGQRTTKYLTRILASNLRELLKREREKKHEAKSKAEGIDLSQLQKNIDDWTEQEFTSLSHRPSTPTIAGRSKNIPPEYLTTTPATPRQAKTTNNLLNVAELSSSINNLEPLLLDRGSKRFEYPPIEDNRIPDSFYESRAARKKTTSTTTTTTHRPEYITPTTTTAKTATTKEGRPFYAHSVPSTSAPTELWQKAQVSISPQTKERVYVVTPQPLFFPQRPVPFTVEAPLESRATPEKAFKAPRFLVRPTPGIGPSKSTSAPPSLYTPDIFGLSGLSAFIPSKPVEIITGNSKVVTIVTPAYKATSTRHRNGESKTQPQPSRSTSKPTMAPSPR